MSDNIKVVVKVRPLISREIEEKLSYKWRVKNNTLYQLDQNGKELRQSFTFDKVYDRDTKTTDVYDDIAKPIVQAATAGFNGTIFAYGQTSTGKTYTMTGTDRSPGIIPLAVIDLFEIIRNVPDRDFLVRVSYIEIYNETVKDLLNVDKKDIKIHESSQGIKVDATERVTSSPDEVFEAMREGEANRQKGATNMNGKSDRSHSIFQIIIESREHIEGEEEPGCVNVSQLNLVDLAGSERSGQTGATGIRFKEGTHINKSLSALALVIKQRSEDPNKFANYRDSKLTRILQNSLGGNAKTSIICTITPAAVEETISTLQFANRAKAVNNKPKVNAVVTADATMIQRLTKQMCKLQAQLESKKNIEQDNYKLQSKIQNLQKLILNGFAQRGSVELMSGARRKLWQPRRITISTLHYISDDEPVVSIPKFCTSSLNPALVKPDRLPIPSDSKLPAVPEEPERLVTPPPTRTVFFSNEVIELDSDDDVLTRDDVETCSPVHKCYDASKTPPCVLRRNAKEAERDLQDIMELTEREKLFSPNVVEYIEKLEQNTTVIAQLQDQIEHMTKQSKEKDLEVEHLKSKIKQTEEAMKSLTSSKVDLQVQCNNYNTRLTDVEVSYETLRNKAKLREQELLSLLEELNTRNKKPEEIGPEQLLADHTINSKCNSVRESNPRQSYRQYELGLSSMKTIETLIDNIGNKHQNDLTGIMEQYTKLQVHMESVTKEVSSVNENLAHVKYQLLAKEEECNLIKKQKERIHEISNAVKLDVVKKDKELTETISNGYKKLIELNVVRKQDVDLTLPVTVNIHLLFEHLFNLHKNGISPDTEKEIKNLALEVKNSKEIIEVKQKEIEDLQKRSQNLQEMNSAVTIDLADKNNKLQAQSTLYKDLNKIYESKVKENKANSDLIEKLTEEVKLLKSTITEKEKAIKKLELEIATQNDSKISEFTKLLHTKYNMKVLQDDLAHLKAMNEVIVKEKDSYDSELLNSGETLKQNSIEMDKMTSEILVLRESVRENGITIENMSVEAKNLLKLNMELKEKLEDKCRECSRLETNIKTHEKTAEIQSRMIMRVEKQKNEDDKTISEKMIQIEELKLKNSQQNDIYSNEIELLRKAKETLEARVTELEELLSNKSRPSIDALADLSRRRRQTLHDSKRMFGEEKQEFGDHGSVEAVFDSRPKPDDLFMDVDEDTSNRSSPIMRHSKGRDSLSLSKTDQDEDQPSRPSSVVATRQRRQSIYDLHSSVLRHTPSPGLHQSNRILDEFNHSKPYDTSGDAVSEVSHLREHLAFCQQELEDLKEKYRELDEECETCAEYLRERDAQCSRLKKEKAALQATVSDLKEKLQSCNPDQSQQIASKPSVAHIGVNTDEEWTKLHSVDRMSFVAEVEKNKKLTKTIEELRFKKQDLKNTLAKMQKALEKNSNHRELDATRHELQACKQELVQLREKNKDLDEECETCAQYLREKEEQCRRLIEAKKALETQLQEFQRDHNAKSQSTRKKRQSHVNRTATVDVKDACTETRDDFLSYQVELDGSGRPKPEDKTKEIKHLRLNQQLTDLMKENQKLEKINARLVNICKKSKDNKTKNQEKRQENKENEDPADQG